MYSKKTLSPAATLTAIFAGLSMIVTPAATAQSAAKTATGSSKAQRIVVTDSNDGEQNTVHIQVEGEDIKVVRNGKEVPQAQIVQQDGKIIITDKEGKPVQTIGLNLKREPGAYAVVVQGEPLTQLYHSAAAAAAGKFEPGPTPKVMLGVHMAHPHPALLYHFNLDKENCTMIAGVYEGLPAEKAGLKPYDIIVEVDGQKSADPSSVRQALADLEPNQTLHITVIQKGRERDFSLKLPEYDPKAMAQSKLIGDESNPFGFTSTWTTELPQMEAFKDFSQVFVTPEVNREFFKALEKGKAHEFSDQGAQGFRWYSEGQGNIDQQLERLDKRMADLEKLLQRLAEQQERNR